MKNIVSLIFLYLMSYSLSQELPKDSSDAVLHYENELIVRTFVGVKNLDYKQAAKWVGLSRKTPYYDSPSTLNFGVGLHSEFMGFHLWFDTGKVLDYDLNDEERKKYDFQANLYTERVGYDLNFQHYKGLYFNDEDRVVYQPNSKVIHLGGVVMYALNKQFSLASSFTQVSKQLQSQGSVILFGGVSYSDIDLLRKSEVFSLSVGGGYSYDFVYKNWFASLLFVGAPAFQRYEGLGSGSYKLGLHLNTRFGVGYNGDRWIYGVTFVDDSQLFRYSNHDDRLDKYHVKLFVAYRFYHNWKKYKLINKLVK